MTAVQLALLFCAATVDGLTITRTSMQAPQHRDDLSLTPEPNPAKVAVAFGILLSGVIASVLYLVMSTAVLQRYSAQQEAVGPVRELINKT